MKASLIFAASALAVLLCSPPAPGAVIVVSDSPATPRLSPTPVTVAANLARLLGPQVTPARLQLSEAGNPAPISVQFEPDTNGSLQGRLCWLIPPGRPGPRQFALTERAAPAEAVMQARPDATGRWLITDAGKPVLAYNYQTNAPGELLAKIQPGNLKYARPRSDYIHPLYGPDGEELTRDWSVDHPHHRGIYWAWPEVDYGGQRGDLHALQRVFARPTGSCAGQSGPVFAQIEAENLWRWDDQEPIVRERATIRAWRADAAGRCLDLEFRFTALKDGVAIARRETKLYGGLNIRLAKVQNQQILLHTDPAEASPRQAWAQLSGSFAGSELPAALAIFQKPTNPDYPGDWVKYPELNWLQPTFPAAGTRYVLKQGQPLVLQYRLWIQPGAAAEAKLTELWATFAHPPTATVRAGP